MLTYTFLAVVQVHGCTSIEEANLKFAKSIPETRDLTLRAGWACYNDKEISYALRRASIVLGETIEEPKT